MNKYLEICGKNILKIFEKYLENFRKKYLEKGDANDGKPDAFRISKSEKVQIWLEFQYYGWFGMDFENIQAEPPKEARGQS